GKSELKAGKFVNSRGGRGGAIAKSAGIVQKTFLMHCPIRFRKGNQCHDHSLLAVASVVKNEQPVAAERQKGERLPADAGALVRPPRPAIIVGNTETVALIAIVTQSHRPGGGHHLAGRKFGE